MPENSAVHDVGIKHLVYGHTRSGGFFFLFSSVRTTEERVVGEEGKEKKERCQRIALFMILV